MRMTDKEIIKALKCCTYKPKCEECPYMQQGFSCFDVEKDALDLINRQRQELEMVGLSLESMLYEVKNAHELRDKAITNAIKYFAERLKAQAKPHYFDNCHFAVKVEDIDNIANELISGKCENQDENLRKNVKVVGEQQ